VNRVNKKKGGQTRAQPDLTVPQFFSGFRLKRRGEARQPVDGSLATRVGIRPERVEGRRRHAAKSLCARDEKLRTGISAHGPTHHSCGGVEIQGPSDRQTWLHLQNNGSSLEVTVQGSDVHCTNPFASTSSSQWRRPDDVTQLCKVSARRSGGIGAKDAEQVRDFVHALQRLYKTWAVPFVLLPVSLVSNAPNFVRSRSHQVVPLEVLSTVCRDRDPHVWFQPPPTS
jgi:hypothetical protein